MKNEHWSFDELKAFMMIHASHADLDFTECEKNSIRNEVGVDIFDRMDAVYNLGSDYQNLHKILAHKSKYFDTTEKKGQFLKKLTEQFESDGEFSRLEKILFQLLEKLI